jgi:23S rRNA (uracil1939-C5)-methyltransferase
MTRTASQSVEPTAVTLEKPVYGGSCLAHAGGKAVFVPLTLPGEEARVHFTETKSGYATAEVDEILSASPDRVAPVCPYFGACGGCNYQHASYAAQLAFKQAILRETLERGGVSVPAQISALSGDPWGYRNRIRLAFDDAGNPSYRGRRSHAMIPVRECPIAAPLLIQAALTFAECAGAVAHALKPTEIALFTNADESSLLLTITTADAAKVPFEQLAQALKKSLPVLKGIELVMETEEGRQPRVLAQWGAASLVYRAAGFGYRVDHGAFFQVNRWLVDALVAAVLADHKGALAWDLYAGVGLFARQLTARFDRVVAVESAPASTQALAANLKGTRGAPVRSATLDFLRRPQAKGNTTQAVPDLIVVDPPRTGLGSETTKLLAKIAAPALVYVSCDPATLARDLAALIASGYAIHSITVADLFPQTFHLETVVHLRRA